MPESEGGASEGDGRNSPNIPLYSTDGWRSLSPSRVQKKSPIQNTNGIPRGCIIWCAKNLRKVRKHARPYCIAFVNRHDMASL